MYYNKWVDDNKVTYFGQTDARNERLRFGIKAKDRTRHVYTIGKTGMGKSTMLENMAVQDIQNGEGLAFIDPHGKTADLLLDYVPEDRIKDVLYFAPFDMEYPISFNVMEDVGPDKRHLVSNGLMSSFKKIWIDAWSARMEYILNNILLALLEYPDSTILGVNRMLADKEYRKKVVDNITDVSVKAFWVDEFAKYGDRYMQEAGAAIQNKIGQFISNPLVRNIVGQSHSAFDLRKFMDDRKIIIVNLSKGRVGEANANLLGSMLVTKIYLAAMSRADVHESTLQKLPNFYLYVDEFQSFANESFADILSEARKYKLNLTIAHQYIEQMSEEVRAAVFGNVGTMISFRVGAYDAEVLEKEFAPQFTAQDMVNLGFTQVYLKLMIDGVTSPPFSATTLPPIERQPVSYKNDVIEHTRKAFARPRATIESEIKDWSQAHRVIASVGPKREVRQAIMTDRPLESRPPSSESQPPRENRPQEPRKEAPRFELQPREPHVEPRNQFREPMPTLTPAPQSVPQTPPREARRPMPQAENRPPIRPSIQNTPPKIEEDDGFKPLSLESLRPKKIEPARNPDKNKEELRQALASMLKRPNPNPADEANKKTENQKPVEFPQKKVETKTETKTEPRIQVPEVKKEEPKQVPIPSQLESKKVIVPEAIQDKPIGEVPEKVLRTVLEVKKPDVPA